MKKVLVHLHLFYHNQLDYFLEKLKNITDCDWDLYVTVCSKEEESEQKILLFKPDAKIILVENKGYDILPFLNVIKTVNLDDYDFVLKLHTKGTRDYDITFKGISFSDYFWRNQLVDSLIGKKEIFQRNLNKISIDYVGMLVNSYFCLQLLNYPEDTYLLAALKEKLNIKSDYRYFLAGSMFLIKSVILKRLQNFSVEEDINEGRTGDVGTVFHALERIFTILTDDEGYVVQKIPMC